MFEIPWQDIVLSVGNFIFFLALLPSIFSKDKPSLYTSFVTALVLSLFAYTFYTLNLTLTMTASLFSATGWWVLFAQKLISK